MLNISAQGVPHWAEQGPAPILDIRGKVFGTGAIVDVAVHPEQPEVIYAATAGGGVWRTRDATPDNLSPTCEPLTDFHPSTAMSCIAFALGDAHRQTLYAGTGSYASFGPTGPAVGLYRTVDGGGSWTVVGASQLTGQLVRHVLPLRPPYGNVVLVSSPLAITGSTPGVFRSEDGSIFNPLSNASGTGLPLGGGMDLAEDPLQPGTVYVGVGGSKAGIYWSADAGKTWSPAGSGIAAADLSNIGWIRLAMRPGRGGAPTRVYAALIGAGWTLVNIYEATVASGQETWQALPLPPGGGGVIYTFGQSWKFALAADPVHPTLIVAADEGGVWRADVTTPGQPTWSQISGLAFAGANVYWNNPHADAQAMVFDTNGDLLACNDGGIYRLTKPNTDPRWVFIGSTMRNDEPLSVAYDTLARVVTLGASDNTVSYQRRAGEFTFLQLDTSGDGGGQAVDNGADDTSVRYSVWVETAGLKTFTRYTFDAGNNRKDTTSIPLGGMPDADHNESGVFVINNLPEYGNQLLVGGTRVFESIDRGDTVQLVLDLGSNRPTGGLRMAYGARDTDGTTHPEVAYVGIGNQVWVRGAGQTAFQQAAAYNGSGPINNLAVDEHDWHRAYVVESTHVWFTPDAGQTWTECTGNLTEVATDAQGGPQLWQPQVYRTSTAGAFQEALLVSAMGGVFRTLNAADGPAAIWTRFGANLPRCGGGDLKYYPARPRGRTQTGDVLLVGLQGRGAWTLPNASAQLLQPGVLSIEATGLTRTVRLVRSATLPGFLEVYDAPTDMAMLYRVDLASLEQIVVHCAADSSTLIIDNTRGPISVPRGIDFSATGAGDNRLVMKGGVTSRIQHALRRSAGRLILGGRMPVDYRGVQRLDITMRARVFNLELLDDVDQLIVEGGQPLDGAPSMGIHGQIGPAHFGLQLANQQIVELDLVGTARHVQLTNFFYKPRRLQQLRIRGSTQPTQVEVVTTPAGLTTEIQGSGAADNVVLGSVTGSDGSLDQIRGPIKVSNAGGKSLLSVAAANNAQPLASGVLAPNSITGLAPAGIEYDPAGVSVLSVLLPGGSLVVQNTSVPTTVIGGSAITDLRVHATTAPLEFTSGSLVDRVSIGDGLLQPIQGAVSVHGSTHGNVNVVVDASSDSLPREVAVDVQSVRGLGPAAISVSAGSGNPALNSLTLRGGHARTFYSVIDMPDLFTFALQGQGQDIVHVARARQLLTISGATGVTVGGPPLDLRSIAGAVHIVPGWPTTLAINDSARTSPGQATLTAGQLAGLTGQPIGFAGATLRTLDVSLGQGATTLLVGGTPPGASVNIGFGTGPVHVDVQACAGPLGISASSGSVHRVTLSSTAPDVDKGELHPITGPVQLGSGSERIDLVVGDGADRVPRTIRLDASSLAGLAPSPITFGPLHSLLIRLSQAGNRLGINATPGAGLTTVRTGGHDSVEVLARPGATCSLLVVGPFASRDTLGVLTQGAPRGSVAVTQPTGSTPGSIRITRPNATPQVISYQDIGTVGIH